jgi:hypothetical protein
MATTTIDNLTSTAAASITASHYIPVDDGTTTTKLQALTTLIQSISTAGAGGVSLLKSFSSGVLTQRDIIGGTGITVTENTNDVTFSVTQGDININNLAGIASFDLSTADNSSSLFLTSVNLASNVTGTLPIANGGTGQTSFAVKSVLLGGSSIGTAVLDADLEVLVGTASGPEMKTLTPSSPITITQDNSANTVTVGFSKGDYIEQNDNVTLGDVTVGDLTVGTLSASTGGVVTQQTALTSSVTVNGIGGTIVLYTAALTATTNYQFTVNNSAVSTSSVVFLSLECNSNSAVNNGIHVSVHSVSNGSFIINLDNPTNGTPGAITRKIHFFVIG